MGCAPRIRSYMTAFHDSPVRMPKIAIIEMQKSSKDPPPRSRPGAASTHTAETFVASRPVSPQAASTFMRPSWAFLASFVP